MTDCLAPIYGRPSHVFEQNGQSTFCWIWQGCVNSEGYPVRGTKDERYLVHRRVFEETVGPIPEGHELHHVCEVRRCVNPGHVRPVLPREHRRSHCAPLTLALLDRLREGDLSRREALWLGADLGAAEATVSTAIERLVRTGEARRVRRGLYALAGERPQ